MDTDTILTNDKPLFSFVILGDSHVTFEYGTTVDPKTSRTMSGKFEALLAKVENLAPDFVIHLGDISHPSPLCADYGDAARTFFEHSAQFGVPWHLVPGNHDIGEKLHRALPEPDSKISISDRNIAQFEKHYGPQYHSFEHKGCIFVLVNAMLFNSGLNAEEHQWEWLEETLATNMGKRLFLCSHYPLFLCEEEEPDHYDNIGQPARARLVALIRAYDVEGCYSGHVHNFFYNRIAQTHHFTLPSTSFMRHDYLELFRTPPESRELGRYHPAKSGFFWIDVYPEGHIPHLIRQSSPDTLHTHAWRRKGTMPVMDLRMPWCDRQEVSTPWGAEIFERKRVRNDYPLSALWEMGIRDLRIPISDLEEAGSARRVRELAALGHRFTIVMFSLPDSSRRSILDKNRDIIHILEIVANETAMDGMAIDLAALRREFSLTVLLNPVHAEVQGYTSNHGIRLNCPSDLAWLDGAGALIDAVDGFVVGVSKQSLPLDGYAQAQHMLKPYASCFALHLQNVGMYRTTAPDSPEARTQELNRVAEAAILARTYPDTSIVLDNFVEQDRGYFHCFGLVDRTYNPQAGSRLLTMLDISLPPHVQSLRPYQTNHARFIEIDTGGSEFILLLLPETTLPQDGVASELPIDTKRAYGESIDLVTGSAASGTLDRLMSGDQLPLTHPTLFRAVLEQPASAKRTGGIGE